MTVNCQVKRLAVLWGGVLLSISALHGQSSQMLKGSVLDFTGAPIPNTLVTSFTDDRVWTTKTDRNGSFTFADWTSKIRYIEASAPGFFMDSVAITDAPTEPVVFRLEVGYWSQCIPLSISDTLEPPSYELSGAARLTGSVKLLGALPADTTITLWREDLDAALPTARVVLHHRPMMYRVVKETLIAELNLNDNGEFTSAGLDPGFYRVVVVHGDERKSRTFWIARENLTKLPPIDFLLHSASEFPRICPS